MIFVGLMSPPPSPTPEPSVSSRTLDGNGQFAHSDVVVDGDDNGDDYDRVDDDDTNTDADDKTTVSCSGGVTARIPL